MILERKDALIGSDPIQIRSRDFDRLGFSGFHDLLHADLVDRESLLLLCIIGDGQRESAHLSSLISSLRV